MTRVRAAVAADLPFLWRMLSFAASMDGSDAAVAIAQADPALRAYLDGFPREDDIAVLAHDDVRAIGAAWLRLGEPTPSKVWTRAVPELAIATVPEARGRGVGAAMLDELLARAAPRFDAVTLSVRDGSPAVRLYERVGFAVEARIVNRVGTSSLVMRRALR